VTREADHLLARALKAVNTARAIAHADPDAGASRSYYAAFYAISAWLANQGQSYSKHSSVESAVHRDLVKPGIVSKELGEHYSWLFALRNTGDYGGKFHVAEDEAVLAVERATKIVETVSGLLMLKS